jgi:glycosyltransferase involved in cell wall biosynthesis
VIERYLFVAGCPRSGTSALTFLLNEHPQIVLGFERFKRVRAALDPFHFTADQFFSPVLAETDIQGKLLYERLQRRWLAGSVSVIGDKVPLYTRVLPHLLERFPQARVIVMVRDPLDVARSFRRRAADPGDWWPAENDHRLAVEMWNEALARARDAERDGDGERVLLLPYEPLLEGDVRWLEALLGFIGLSPTARLRSEHQRLAAGWTSGGNGSTADPDVLAYVQAHRDLDLLDWARERIDRQLETVPASPVPASDWGDREGEQPLSVQEIGEREREREQLLREMRRPGQRGAEEVEVLERRFLEQGRELARRDGRPRSSTSRQSGVSSGSDRRVTFILPHQRPTTGGVYAIEQFASHLASHLQVSAVVRDTTARAIPGVQVHPAAELDPHELPPADLLVYPADMSDAAKLFELPAAAGRPVMLFQGHGTPGSPIVQANLDRAEEAVAIAHWLVDDALRHGTACTYVPYGLDRDLFAPGPQARERPPRVSVMTHRLDWKGLADALTAAALVRSARADVEMVFFGVEPVEGLGVFLPSPTRAEVASLLRSCAVHVIASWEEGFGMTGAEAIACGAALATTDTKGSRDYAVDGHTALVSPPRDPRALAGNVLRLLDDAELRDRLVAVGQRHLRGVMPPWPEAARRMAFALLEL